MDTTDNEYIDVEDALKRIGGNMGLYKRLLGNFVTGDHIGPLANALNNGDIDEASRLAHTLKGVSANLSLVKLRALSIELENTIKNKTDYSDKLNELSQAFDTTMAKIAEIIA